MLFPLCYNIMYKPAIFKDASHELSYPNIKREVSVQRSAVTLHEVVTSADVSEPLA